MKDFTKPCETCSGLGRVKREPRRNASGEVDLLDILGRFEALCDRCGGSGTVALDPKSILEPQPDSATDPAG